MARLNTRPSTVAGANNSVRGTPALETNSSDQENEEPEPQRRDKGKGRASDMSGRSALPTPDSDTRDTVRGQKRKRAEAQSATQADDIDSDGQNPEDEERFNRYYNPAQDPEQRRQVKRKSRALEREFSEKRDELIKGDGKELSETINRANNVFKNVKQTNDATVDSRLFVNLSNVAQKRSANLVLGDTQTGIDIDIFVSKTCYYMQDGCPMNAEDDAAATQRPTQHRRTQAERDESDDDEDDLGEPLDWEFLGRHACFPYVKRPACPSFLLGPLSVEKKVRKQTQRSARQIKDPNVRETRPEALTRTQLAKTDENGLTAICTRIHKQLTKHIDDMDQEAGKTFSCQQEMESAEGKKWLREHCMSISGGPSLFEYTLNPHSFGQTVENLFYISFLIKEGVVGLVHDEDGLPILIAREPTDAKTARDDDAAPARKKKTGAKHQAVFSIDYETWQKLVKAFDVKEPMIKHRDETEGQVVGDRGWYT